MVSKTLILFFLSAVFAAVHAAPMPMPSPPAPGEYRNVHSKKAVNKNDPNVKIGNKNMPHPAIVLNHPDQHNQQEVAVITHNIGNHPHASIHDVHPETTLTGNVSLRQPMKFKAGDLNRPQHGEKGGPAPPKLDMAQVAHLRQRLAHVRGGGNGQIGIAPAAVNSKKRKASTDSHHSGSESPKPEDHVHMKQKVAGGSSPHHGSAPHLPVHNSPPHSPVHNSPPHSPVHPHSPHRP